jgi:hypothetical protein
VLFEAITGTSKMKADNLSADEHHTLALWAALCAERVLRLFEELQPADDRPRQALTALRAWVRGEQTMAQCRAAAFAAHAAARAATHPAATAAARAAGQAAAVAHVFTHAPHAAEYAAKAVALAAPAALAAAIKESEQTWQRQQLPQALHHIGFPRKKAATC